MEAPGTTGNTGREQAVRPSSVATLDTLLRALHEAGLHVGVTERMRLQQVFSLQPERPPGKEMVARRRLLALVRAVVIKHQEEQQTFERVCAAWLQQADQDVQRLTEPIQPVSRPQPADGQQTVSRWRQRRVLLLGFFLGMVLVLAGVYTMRPGKKPDPLPGRISPQRTETSPPSSDPTTHPRQRSFTSYVPHLQPQPARPPSHVWLLGLGIIAILSTAGTLGYFLHRRFLPPAAPEPTRQGPPRVFLTPPVLPVAQLLDARQQDTLVWGIERFIAEEPTWRLDLAATVQATARAGGIPTVQYVPATYQRQVWLWVDEAAEDSAITRLATEIETTLQAYGLEVERAVFRGIPERLLTATGAVVAPRDLDERREAVLVAVLTDGRVLSRLYAVDTQRVRIEALLRDLSHWPRLAFVDFSAGAQTLAGMLARHDLQCLPPAALAAFFGAETAPRLSRDLQGDEAVWAAACALAPSSLDEATALALLQHLQRQCRLAVSPWALRALRAEAPGPAGRLQWPLRLRATRLNWLRDRQENQQGLATPSVFDAALAFWDTQIQQELRRREEENAVRAWHDTPARQHLDMELQLLRLWYTPATAIPALYRLFQGRLGDAIRQYLRHFVPAGWDAPGAIQWPWSWSSRSATEQAMLQEMGLGGDMPTTHLQRPGRLWLGVGVCAGLALGAFLAAWLRPASVPSEPPTVVHAPAPPQALQPYVGVHTTPAADGQWQVTVSAPRAVAAATVAAATTIQVAWTQVTRPCVEASPDGATLWYCGTLSNPERLGPAIQRSLVIMQTETGDVEVEALAMALLDSGSADVVLVAPDWQSARTRLLGTPERLGPNQQMMVLAAASAASADLALLKGSGWLAQVQASDWSALRHRLRFSGEKPLAAAWTSLVSVRLLGDVAQVRLRGLGEWPDVVFVDIPAGTFVMGSPNHEVGHTPDQGPQHQVSVPTLQMARTETTNAQFRVFEPQHQEQDDLPVVDVGWEKARAFCERYGWRLPTEAEWEYAARAGTQTRWSFGDDERLLGEHAWYRDNAQDQPHPVGRKQPNLWGLFDMHGSVWEWVQDCWHDDYVQAPTDGRAWETDKCTSRVVRGGSFADSPANLRSARRDDDPPVGWGRSYGFRCVRVPPQP